MNLIVILCIVSLVVASWAVTTYLGRHTDRTLSTTPKSVSSEYQTDCDPGDETPHV